MRIPENKNMVHLKAFTIIEMLVVMLLSAIVVGLTYMYFTQFQNYISQTGRNDDVYQTYSRFSMVLQKDLNEAESIKSPEMYELELLSKESKIEYWFDNEWVIRDNMEVLDTFHLLTGELIVTELPNYQGLVKKITFDTEIRKGKFIRFTYLKDYTSKTLFNYYEKNQH